MRLYVIKPEAKHYLITQKINKHLNALPDRTAASEFTHNVHVFDLIKEVERVPTIYNVSKSDLGQSYRCPC